MSLIRDRSGEVQHGFQSQMRIIPGVLAKRAGDFVPIALDDPILKQADSSFLVLLELSCA